LTVTVVVGLLPARARKAHIVEPVAVVVDSIADLGIAGEVLGGRIVAVALALRVAITVIVDLLPSASSHTHIVEPVAVVVRSVAQLDISWKVGGVLIVTVGGTEHAIRVGIDVVRGARIAVVVDSVAGSFGLIRGDRSVAVVAVPLVLAQTIPIVVRVGGIWRVVIIIGSASTAAREDEQQTQSQQEQQQTSLHDFPFRFRESAYRIRLSPDQHHLRPPELQPGTKPGPDDPRLRARC
jgi:hypothetical protein